MRTTILSCLLLICIASTAQKRNVQLGLKAGVNIANFNDDAHTSDSRIGFHGGMLFHVPVQQNLAIQPEFVYSTQGAEYNQGKQKLDYLNIPFLIQYVFRSGFRLQTGPQIGFLVNSEFKTNNGVEYDNDGSFKKSDVAWVLGFSFVSSSGLGVDARWNAGLSDITKNESDVMNRVWQLGMFYQFRK